MLVGLVLALGAVTANALPMAYSFEVDFTSGNLGGTSSRVDVTLDGVVGVGPETFFPGAGNLLAFDFTFGADAFSLPHEFSYPFGPSVRLRDGELLSVYWVPEFGDPTATLFYFPEGTPPNNQVMYVSASGTLSEGVIDGSSWGAVTAVPAPASLTLFAAGAIGFGWSTGKRRRLAGPLTPVAQE